MKRVLVTGGAGFIGSNFIHYIDARRDALNIEQIVCLDLLTYAGDANNFAGADCAFARGDICDELYVSNLIRKYQIDTVVHFAAETHVDRSIKRAGVFIETNVGGTCSVLEAIRKADHPVHFHFIDSDEVFGPIATDQAPATESAPFNPSSPYAASKAAANHLVKAYHKTYGVKYTITNCTNNYGPRQFPEKLIPLAITKWFNDEPVPVYGDGSQARDWIFVDDHNEAVVRVINGPANHSYNVGSGTSISNMDLLKTLHQALCIVFSGIRVFDFNVVHVEDRLGHDKRYAVDTTKIQSILGWQPTHTVPGVLDVPYQNNPEYEIHPTLRTGLVKTVLWYAKKAGLV